jgi:SAM-dependent methyltransferase
MFAYFIYFLVFSVIFCLLTVGLSSLSLAPWLPTRKEDFERICRLAQLRPGEIFYDLGCGTGGLLAHAGRNYGVRAIGLELSLPLCLICRARRMFGRAGGARFKFKNLYRENLAKADVVYLFAQSRRKLRGALLEKLKKELKPGARVITYVFPIAEWIPDAVDKPGKNDLAIYKYVI